MKDKELKLEKIIPTSKEGTWIGRCYVPTSLAYKGVAGPHVVQIKDDNVYDLSAYFKSSSELINFNNPGAFITQLTTLPKLGSFPEICENSLYTRRDGMLPYFLAPNDAQAIKACGVTFIRSLLERVIEEKAEGDAAKASKIRATIKNRIGTDLNKVKPGSAGAMKLKTELQEQGIWSQYLEVGIGKDAEVFTKSQPFSAVGFGAQIGILKDSLWNNPEPEVVLVVSNQGTIVGATLGNDVNLRDYEGRSALLLGEAKDQNGSCSIGPLFRLFDDSFTLETIKDEVIHLQINGKDGFCLDTFSQMNKISRPPEKLVAQVIGNNHQYPDGLVLFCGTMFAPTKDRDFKGQGFTHKIGDEVIIHSEHLGILMNWVNTCDQLPKWDFGITSFVEFCIKRK